MLWPGEGLMLINPRPVSAAIAVRPRSSEARLFRAEDKPLHPAHLYAAFEGWTESSRRTKSGVRIRRRAFLPVVIVLLTTLFMAPPGASVVWPFPGARHLHIGWIEPTGGLSPHLIVFTHRTTNPVAADRRPTAAQPFQSSVAAPVTPQPLNALWLACLASLSWLLLAPPIFIIRTQPLPEEPPPRAISF